MNCILKNSNVICIFCDLRPDLIRSLENRCDTRLKIHRLPRSCDWHFCLCIHAAILVKHLPEKISWQPQIRTYVLFSWHHPQILRNFPTEPEIPVFCLWKPAWADAERQLYETDIWRSVLFACTPQGEIWQLQRPPDPDKSFFHRQTAAEQEATPFIGADVLPGSHCTCGAGCQIPR